MARPKKNITPPAEPEVMGPDSADPVRAAIATEKKRKTKVDPFITTAVDWLKAQIVADPAATQFTVSAVLREAYKLGNTPADAVLGFLKQAKNDSRLIVGSKDGNAIIALVGEDLEPSDAQPVEQQTKPKPVKAAATETKSIAEHLAESEGRPTQLQFPHGPGTWVSFVGEPACIVNMATGGGVTLYDLKTKDGKHKEVPAWKIDKLPADVVARIQEHAQLLQLQKHNAAGRQIAEMLAQEQALEVKEAETLKATRKRIDGLQEKLNKHPYNLVAGDQMQIDMDEDTGEGAMTSPGETPKAVAPITPDTSTAQERLLARISGKDTLELTSDAQPWEKLKAATLKSTDSTGKPYKVIPLTIDQAPGDWVCVDMQDGVAVLLQALPLKEWEAKYLDRFGPPRDLPAHTPSLKQSAGGPLTGSPVKVKRAVLYLSPLDDALLLRMPAAVASA